MKSYPTDQPAAEVNLPNYFTRDAIADRIRAQCLNRTKHLDRDTIASAFTLGIIEAAVTAPELSAAEARTVARNALDALSIVRGEAGDVE